MPLLKGLRRVQMPTGPKTLEEARRLYLAHSISRIDKPTFAKPKKADGFLPVICTGGVGDLILTLPLIDKIIETVGPIKLFCNYQEVFNYFRPKLGKYISNEPFPGFDYWLRIDTAPRFFLGKKFKKIRSEVEPLYIAGQLFKSGKMGKYIDAQPFMDYELWGHATRMGLKRHTIGAMALGLKTNFIAENNGLPIDLERFITVHDGQDITQKMIPYRSTKTWNLRSWGEFVQKFKRDYPHIYVVQLGAQSSRPIPGVDVNFSGRLRIEQSFNVLSRSLLHVDGDSGLTHAARHMGIRSVVMFGSTPPDFFGYEENINLRSSECSPCGWVNDNWLNKCTLYDKPICLDYLSVKRVFEAVKNCLEIRSQ